MSLVSLAFYCFFAVVFAAYYWLARSNALQKWVLLVASYVFYAFFDYRFCALLLATSLAGHGLGRWLCNSTGGRSRRAALITGLVLNLAVLGTFKYFDFFSAGATKLLTSLGLNLDMVTLRLLLPVGISFYLFKIMSHLIDAYRRPAEGHVRVLDFLVYVAFFPQLLSGPIDRATTFLPQLEQRRDFNYDLAIDGTRQLL